MSTLPPLRTRKEVRRGEQRHKADRWHRAIAQAIRLGKSRADRYHGDPYRDPDDLSIWRLRAKHDRLAKRVGCPECERETI
ncbi:MAG: hypothetical protein A2W26_04970 [Acidobacteria bacterium RBG_16_64_8]|nr:MAG: hypothetical protein A2W26_04970 [Acidobacteria bacterium RBG_16_64_8]